MADRAPTNPKKFLSSSELRHIAIEKPVLMRAQTLVSVPWQAMAAIWYRESFSLSTTLPGGPFQFDPPDPPSSVLQSLLTRFSKATPAEVQQIISRGVKHFDSACILAACHLRKGAKYNLSTNHSDAAMKDAFLGYNGRAYSSPDQSPYVMNNFDDAHKNMRIRGTIVLPGGTRKWVDTIDLNPGAFTIYKQLISLKL